MGYPVHKTIRLEIILFVITEQTVRSSHPQVLVGIFDDERSIVSLQRCAGREMVEVIHRQVRNEQCSLVGKEIEMMGRILINHTDFLVVDKAGGEGVGT